MVFYRQGYSIGGETIMIGDLILLPWVLFKYIFSIGLWGLFFTLCHYYWNKHECSDWTVKAIRKARGKKYNRKKELEEEIDWENGV
tara:strand:+ start:476 stop:733 length:258 start_codon:yes stop_codon:yes gene_type:complete